MSISYNPIIYPSIELKDISFIHIWESYSPSTLANYDFQYNPIEICMIQLTYLSKKQLLFLTELNEKACYDQSVSDTIEHDIKFIQKKILY